MVLSETEKKRGNVEEFIIFKSEASIAYTCHIIWNKLDRI